MFVSGSYLLLFLLSLYATYLLMQNISTKKASYYIVLFTLITVVCLAYFTYSISQNEGMALVACQFSFLDSTFVLMFFLFCVMDICGIRVNKILGIFLTFLALLFLTLAFTTEFHHLIYKSVEFGKDLGASHLTMEFGPLHNLFLIYVVLNTLAPIGIVTYSAFRGKKISYKHVNALGLLLIAIVLLYFVQNFINLDFDLLPCGYVLMEYVILIIQHRIALYDASQIVLEATEERKEFGYIIFDTNLAYVSSNSVARFFFPEINKLDIDRKVGSGFIKEEFVDHIDTSLNSVIYSKVFSRNDKYIRCTIEPYTHGKRDKVYGYIVEMIDDTEQQKHILELNSINEELERAVNEANDANNAKSDFLAKMSHEIRTPINAILGMNEIALRKCEDKELVTYLNNIDSAGHNLLSIINDILDFSKIEARKIEIIEGEYKICELVKELKGLVEIKVLEKDLNLIININPDIPSVLYGDENRLRQIILNILNNSVKYTPSGDVKLEINYQQSSSDNINLIVTVSDTGIGIKKENLPYIFDSFSRADERNNKNIEGTGLGLAITDRLVTMMGGLIKVESEYGKGSTFTAVIPQIIIDSTPIGDFETYLKLHENVKKEKTHIDASNLNILVVDDNMVNLSVAKGLLDPTGANIVACKSGEECLNLIQFKHFDLILLDHMMPGMDGIETLHTAKSLENSKCKDSIFIALTANAISGIRESYINEGFDDYISKPIDSATLEQMISDYCIH